MDYETVDKFLLQKNDCREWSCGLYPTQIVVKIEICKTIISYFVLRMTDLCPD